MHVLFECSHFFRASRLSIRETAQLKPGAAQAAASKPKPIVINEPGGREGSSKHKIRKTQRRQFRQHELRMAEEVRKLLTERLWVR